MRESHIWRKAKVWKADSSSLLMDGAMRDIHEIEERCLFDKKFGPKGDRKELFTIVRFNYLPCPAPLPQRRMNKEFNYRRVSVAVPIR